MLIFTLQMIFKWRAATILAVHRIGSVIKTQWGPNDVRGLCSHCAEEAEKRGGRWVTAGMGMGPRPSVCILLPLSHSPHFPESVVWRPERLPSFTLSAV